MHVAARAHPTSTAAGLALNKTVASFYEALNLMAWDLILWSVYFNSTDVSLQYYDYDPYVRIWK
jgi:hypothetical protein